MFTHKLICCNFEEKNNLPFHQRQILMSRNMTHVAMDLPKKIAQRIQKSTEILFQNYIFICICIELPEL